MNAQTEQRGEVCFYLFDKKLQVFLERSYLPGVVKWFFCYGFHTFHDVILVL